ncbi:MAG TPA: hypothetical protein VEF90_05605 [Xanthobacteraceae bacterium]|nr:hypothetical protein [Xanthobacteraceae bacterium]
MAVGINAAQQALNQKRAQHDALMTRRPNATITPHAHTRDATRTEVSGTATAVAQMRQVYLLSG